jgi:hypothetical protein
VGNVLILGNYWSCRQAWSRWPRVGVLEGRRQVWCLVALVLLVTIARVSAVVCLVHSASGPHAPSFGPTITLPIESGIGTQSISARNLGGNQNISAGTSNLAAQQGEQRLRVTHNGYVRLGFSFEHTSREWATDCCFLIGPSSKTMDRSPLRLN